MSLSSGSSSIGEHWAAFRRSRELVWAVPLAFVLGLAYSFVGPFISLFGTVEVGLEPWEFGIFMTVTSLAGVAFGTLLGRWSDLRFSRKSMLLATGITGAFGYLGYAYLRQPWELVLVGCLFLGISSAAFSQLFAYVRDLVESKEELKSGAPFHLNVIRLCFAFAWTVGPMLAAWLMARGSFEAAFVAAAALFGLFSLMVLLFVEKRAPSAAAREAAGKLSLSGALAMPAVLACFLAFCLHQACATMGMMNLPLFLTESVGGGRDSVAIAYSLAPVFEIPFMVAVGILGLRVSHLLVIRAAVFLAIIYYAGLFLAGSPLHVYALQILSAGIVAVMSGLAITFFQDFMPGQPGSATNLYATSSRIGSTAGYLAFGFLGTAGGYRTVFLVCAASSALGFLLLALAPSARQARPA